MMTNLGSKDMKYSVEVFKDYAIVRGNMTIECWILVMKFLKEEGFTYLTHADDECKGFKLIRRSV